MEYYAYETAENKAYKVLVRWLPPEVTAEMVISELKHLEYPIIHVRQFRCKTYCKNLQQRNSLFLSLHIITYTLEQNTLNTTDLIVLFSFRVHIED
jgi:hypothetical protein